MVTKAPPPESMSPEGRQRMAELAETIEEDDDLASRNGDSVKDLEPETDGFRYKEVKIFGIAKKVRFRSLTARQFEKIATEEDRNILLHSICDATGRLLIDPPEILTQLIDRYDARTYAELLSAANMHCLGRGGLDDMVQESAGN